MEPEDFRADPHRTQDIPPCVVCISDFSTGLLHLEDTLSDSLHELKMKFQNMGKQDNVREVTSAGHGTATVSLDFQNSVKSLQTRVP